MARRAPAKVVGTAPFPELTSHCWLENGRDHWFPANGRGEPGRGMMRQSPHPTPRSPCIGTALAARPARQSANSSNAVRVSLGIRIGRLYLAQRGGDHEQSMRIMCHEMETIKMNTLRSVVKEVGLDRRGSCAPPRRCLPFRRWSSLPGEGLSFRLRQTSVGTEKSQTAVARDCRREEPSAEFSVGCRHDLPGQGSAAERPATPSLPIPAVNQSVCVVSSAVDLRWR